MTYDFFKTPQMRVEYYALTTGTILGAGVVDSDYKMKSRVRVLCKDTTRDFRLLDGRLVGGKTTFLRPAERCRVKVQIEWGKVWTGSYFKETPGKGLYVTVLEERVPYNDYDALNRYEFPGFNGCPLGSYNTDCDDESTAFATERAISDFIDRSRYEWRGQTYWCRSLVKIGEVRDVRKPVVIEVLPPKTLEDVLVPDDGAEDPEDLMTAHADQRARTHPCE